MIEEMALIIIFIQEMVALDWSAAANEDNEDISSEEYEIFVKICVKMGFVKFTFRFYSFIVSLVQVDLLVLILCFSWWSS